MSTRASVGVGGWALIIGALAFMGVFAFLAARFDYPAILDGTAADVFPRLLATGELGRAVWALYALLPLIWLPAGVGAYCAMRRSHPGAMLLAVQFASLEAVTMMLGLMRWPSIHWRMAEAYGAAGPEQRAMLSTVFDGLNTYLGNYIGEFLGELSFSIFFLLSGWAMFRSGAGPRWAASIGLLTGASGPVGSLRNVTHSVASIAAINNYLLPLWMIVFGIVLLRHREEEAPSAMARNESESL